MSSRAAGAEEARYTCSQCFTVHYQNDVLFRAKRGSGLCDTRQAARRYALCTHSVFTEWCEAGEAAALLNWRALPQSRRRWSGGAITAVRDMDGSWVTQRVCPCCHISLPPPCPVVFGWKGEGMDGRIASDLLYLASETALSSWRLRRENGLPLWYDYLTDPVGAAMGVPVALESAKEKIGSDCIRRCCTAAAGAVVYLELRMDEDGRLDDGAAFLTLHSLLDICGHSGMELKLPTVFLLDGLEGGEDTMERLQRECSQLIWCVQYNFENYYFAVGAHDHPQVAVQAVEWLSGHISRLNPGE